jgi:hypothetical protein
MTLVYEIGQKVIIKPVNGQSLSPRDCTIEPYIGQIGKVADYYWVSPPAGEVFYVYLVRVEDGNKEIVLHEDEIEAF